MFKLSLAVWLYVVASNDGKSLYEFELFFSFLLFKWKAVHSLSKLLLANEDQPHIMILFIAFSEYWFSSNKTDILAHRLKVSYCDWSLSVLSPSVNFFFKQHLPLNQWSKFKIISQEYFP